MRPQRGMGKLHLPATLAFVVVVAAGCGASDPPTDAQVVDVAEVADRPGPDACFAYCLPEDAGIDCPTCTDDSVTCPFGCYVS